MVIAGITLSTSCMRTLISSVSDESFIASAPAVDSLVHAIDSVNITETLASGKHIYLTIDDAPFNGSKYIDSVIFNAKVKASIFMIGNMVNGSSRFQRYHKMLKKNPYIELYNHSYSHANHRYASYYQNPEQVVDDFERNSTEFNLSTQIARLPGRNLWQIGDRKKNYKQTGADAATLLAEKGYKIFGWDVEWKYDHTNFTPLQTIDELVEEIENAYNSDTFTSNHVVLLMHDQMFVKKTGENDLSKLIEKLKAAGYTFEYLRSYPELAAK